MTAEVDSLPASRLSDFSKTARRRRRSVWRMPVDQRRRREFIWSRRPSARPAPLHAAVCRRPGRAGARGAARLPQRRRRLRPCARARSALPRPASRRRRCYALEILHEAGARGDRELARDARAWIASIADAGWRHPVRAGRLRGLSARAVVVAAAGLVPDVRARRDPARRRRHRRRMAGARHRLVLAARSSTAEQPSGYWLKYACAFLDAVPDERARSGGDRVARHSRRSGRARAVAGARRRGAACRSTSRPVPAAGRASSSAKP